MLLLLLRVLTLVLVLMLEGGHGGSAVGGAALPAQLTCKHWVCGDRPMPPTQVTLCIADPHVVACPAVPLCRQPMPWFHGKIDRDLAESLLMPREDGLYLVRESTNFPGDYTLCVAYQADVDHYRIQGVRGKITIDEEVSAPAHTHSLDAHAHRRTKVCHACRNPPLTHTHCLSPTGC